MKLKTITLSNDIRDQLEASMQRIIDQGRTKDNEAILSAFSEAVWDKDTSGELSSSLIALANATGSPALVVSNLPHENQDIYKLALTGLSLSINSGRKTIKDRNPPEVEKERGYYTGHASAVNAMRLVGRAIDERSKQKLHSDNAGFAMGPEVRMLAGITVGSRPLPTAVVPIDEWIDAIAETIEKLKKPAGIQLDWDKERIRQEVIKILKAPIWEKRKIFTGSYKTNTDIINQSYIFDNPNKNLDAPRYGLLRDPDSTITLAENWQQLAEDLAIDKNTINAINRYSQECLTTMKQEAASVVLEPGMALLWNDQMVLHGGGVFKNFGTADIREMYDINIPLANPTSEVEVRTPGAVPLVSAIQTSNPQPTEIASPLKH